MAAKDLFKDIFYEVVSMYRLIPLMILALPENKRINSAAWLCAREDLLNYFESKLIGIVSISKVSLNRDLDLLLESNKAWIRYVFDDFQCYCRLFAKVPHVHSFLENTYLDRMREQALTIATRFEPFIPDKKRIVMLDIGCGNISHMENFLASNKGQLIDYYGMDIKEPKVPDNTNNSFLIKKLVVKDFWEAHTDFKNIAFDVIFMGEFLHCFDPIRQGDALEKVVDRYPFKKMIILELIEERETSLNIGFNTHMRLHCDGAVVRKKMLETFAIVACLKFSYYEPNPYQIVYVLEK
jgi:SAM-dependent methyltransferase